MPSPMELSPPASTARVGDNAEIPGKIPLAWVAPGTGVHAKEVAWVSVRSRVMRERCCILGKIFLDPFFSWMFPGIWPQ